MSPGEGPAKGCSDGRGPMASLASRLHLGLALSLVVLIGAAWWLGHEALHRTTEAYVSSRLRHDAEALLGMLRPGPDGGLHLVPDSLMPIYNQPFSGHYYEIRQASGEVMRSRSLWDQGLDAPPVPPGEEVRTRAQGPDGQRLLIRSAGYAMAGTPLTIAVAEDLTPSTSFLADFERLFGLLAVLGLALMVLVQRRIVQHTFRRLRPVYEDIEGLEQGTRRSLTEAVPAEILPLVAKLNRLLAVYDKRLARSRNAAGNLAHALKGPLHLMLQQIDRPEGLVSGQGRRLCREQVERIHGLVERELRRARIAGGGAPGSIFDPDAELPALQTLLSRMYPDKVLDLNCRTALPGPVAADREDMLEIVGILLDNACKWCEGVVECRLEASAAGLLFVVEDDGPGCPSEELASIAERGVRLDERVAGHGLGLSIVREIVEVYQGRIEMGRSPALGGLLVRVELPVKVARPRSP